MMKVVIMMVTMMMMVVVVMAIMLQSMIKGCRVSQLNMLLVAISERFQQFRQFYDDAKNF